MAPMSLNYCSMSKMQENGTQEILHLGSLGLQKTGHILDTEDMDTFLDELVDEVKVVLKGIFGLLGVGDVTAVADDGFADTTGLLGSVNAEFHLKRELGYIVGDNLLGRTFSV